MELREHYVYVLIDPRNGDDVFYVGKGIDERATQHEKENGSTEKNNRIEEIIASDNEVKKRVIGRYRTKEEAFAVESTLMHWMYGYNNLTNQQSGHGVDYIREHGVFDELQDLDEVLDTSKAGYQSNKYKGKRDKYNIYEFMRPLHNKSHFNSHSKS